MMFALINLESEGEIYLLCKGYIKENVRGYPFWGRSLHKIEKKLNYSVKFKNN